MKQKSRILSTQLKVHEEEDAKASENPLELAIIAKHEKSEEVKWKWIECFKFINGALPFYLPLQQHKMVPSKLDFKDREYWGNAIHFLLSNKAHGFPMWKQFQEQVRSMDATVTCRPHISTEKTNLILKHLQGSTENYQNSSFDAFLANESIMVQLPFQPVLLFQWLTSAMYRISLLELDNYVFSRFPFPAKFKPQIERLQKAMTEVHMNIGFLFDYLQHQVESENEIFVGNLQLFEKVLKKVLDGISIFYNQQTLKFFKYISNNTLTESWQDERLCKLKKTAMPLKERNFIFNLDFWRALPNKDLKMFGSSEEKLVRKAPINLTMLGVSYILRGMFKTELVDLINLNQLMLDHDFLEKMDNVYDIVDEYYSLFISGNQGSVGDVLTSNAFNTLEIAKLEVACLLCENSKIPLRILLNLQPSNLAGSDIGNLVSTFSEIEKKPLSLQMLLMGSYHDNIKHHNFDDFDHLKENTVNVFEKKIVEIILNCIFSNLKIKNFEKEKDEKLRDWQVAQFLLPCFVASYNNICKANPPIDEDMKVWYAKFIHNLITAYEGKDGIRKSSWKNIKKDIDENSVLKDDARLLDLFESVVASFKNKVKQFPCQIGAFIKFCPIWDSLYEVLSTKNGGSTDSDDISSESSIYWNWLMWDFFSKMKHAISISG